MHEELPEVADQQVAIVGWHLGPLLYIILKLKVCMTLVICSLAKMRLLNLLWAGWVMPNFNHLENAFPLLLDGCLEF